MIGGLMSKLMKAIHAVYVYESKTSYIHDEVVVVRTPLLYTTAAMTTL